MWFAILLLLILFYFFIRPAYKVWKAVSAARRQANEMNEAFRRAAGIDTDTQRQKAAQAQASRKGGWTPPAPRRKKIDPAVGEYIKFKEVETEVAMTSDDDTSSSSARATIVEQQVEDVKWEDIV